MNKYLINIISITEFTWTQFKSKPFFWILVFACISIVQIFADSYYGPIIYNLDVETMSLNFTDSLNRKIIEIILFYFSVSLIKMSIQFMRKKNVDYTMLIDLDATTFLKYICALLVMSAVIGLGFILFIIPGLYFSVRFIFVPYLIIDGSKSILDAFYKSWNMTVNNMIDISLFILILFSLFLFSTVFGQIGLLFMSPFIALLKAYFFIVMLKK